MMGRSPMDYSEKDQACVMVQVGVWSAFELVDSNYRRRATHIPPGRVWLVYISQALAEVSSIAEGCRGTTACRF